MSKRQPSPVVMPIAQAAAAFGLTASAARQFIKAGGLAQGNRVEVGALAAFIARTTMGGHRVQQAT